MAWQYTLNDKASDTELADITPYCLTKMISPRLNRPLSVTLTAPGDTAVFRDTSFDDTPNLRVGNRTIKAYQDGVLKGHTTVWNVAPSGDANSQSIQIVGFDPMQMLLKRPVRFGGNLADPDWPSPISGGEIMIDVLGDSETYDGDLPLDYTLLTPTTTDLSSQLTDWPMTIGDLVTLLTNTGDVDIVIVPIDTHTGGDPGIMGVVEVVDKWGTDISGTVSFDYGTGRFNVSNVRRTFDMDELCNKLYYYLGPKLDPDHWQGNITATEVGLEDMLTLEEASRAEYGTFMDIKVYDSLGIESDARPLFHRLWREEVISRVQPRELLFMTPQAGVDFRPFIDFNIGDVAAVNAADIVGPTIDGALQRIFGFDVSEDKDGPERVSELIVSAADE